MSEISVYFFDIIIENIYIFVLELVLSENDPVHCKQNYDSSLKIG